MRVIAMWASRAAVFGARRRVECALAGRRPHSSRGPLRGPLMSRFVLTACCRPGQATRVTTLWMGSPGPVWNTRRGHVAILSRFDRQPARHAAALGAARASRRKGSGPFPMAKRATKTLDEPAPDGLRDAGEPARERAEALGEVGRAGYLSPCFGEEQRWRAVHPA